jgi:signal transduction histidine kinase
VRRRLFIQIYLSFLSVSLLTLVATGLSVQWAARRTLEVPRSVRVAAQILLRTLPDPGAAPKEFRSALVRRAEELGVHVSVWSESGALLGRVGDRMPDPPEGCDRPWVRSESGSPGLCLQLPEGQWVAVAGVNARTRDWVMRGMGVFLAIFGTIALGCYPLARRITRRLEALQDGVEAFGRGELDRRVSVEGEDEVAAVAAAFNDSADRVATLVARQRRVLAHASHELRSPLARLRMAVALLEDARSDDARSDASARAIVEIDELDDLIEDVLLASRLRGGVAVPRTRGLLDLLEVCAPLAERFDAALLAADGPVWMEGDVRLLERAVGNLLSNARRHAAPPFELAVRAEDGHAEVHVLDRGPGLSEAERERIFEPFFRPAGHREGDPGVGLGLSLVDEIARHHGGSASCAPREDGGMRFTLRFPSVPAPPAE